MKTNELIERLETVADIVKDLNNAATPDLLEAMDEAKEIIKTRHDKKQIMREVQMEKTRQAFNDDAVRVNAAFDNIFDQFIRQLITESNKKKDDKFGR